MNKKVKLYTSLTIFDYNSEEVVEAKSGIISYSIGKGEESEKATIDGGMGKVDIPSRLIEKDGVKQRVIDIPVAITELSGTIEEVSESIINNLIAIYIFHLETKEDGSDINYSKERIQSIKESIILHLSENFS